MGRAPTAANIRAAKVINSGMVAKIRQALLGPGGASVPLFIGENGTILRYETPRELALARALDTQVN